MINYNNCYIFVEVARELNFTKASEILGVSKSFVSKKIQELEAELKVKLIERTTRKMRLTEEGRDFFYEINEAYIAIKNAQDKQNKTRETPQGTLRISAPIEFGQLMAKKVVPDFIKRYPKIDVDFNVSPERKNLIEDKLDLIVSTGLQKNSGLISKRIATAKLSIFASPKDSAKIKRVSDLTNFPLITSCQVKNKKLPLLKTGKKIVIDVSNSQVISNNLTVTKNLIAEGVGIGLLPSFIFADEIAKSEIVRVLPQLSSPEVPISFLYSSKKLTPLKSKLFIDHSIKYFQRYMKEYDFLS